MKSNRLFRVAYILFLLAAIIAVTFFLYKIGGKVKANNVTILGSLSGAFFGTIFGVCAFIVNGWIKGFFDRQHSAHNALVYMESNMNFFLDEINLNIQALSDSKKHLSTVQQRRPDILIHEPGFTSLREISEEYHKISSLDLKNEIMNFELKLTRVVSDLENTKVYLKEIQKIYNEKDKAKLDLEGLFNPFVNRLAGIESYLREFLNKAEHILAMIRVMLDNPPPWIWLSARLNKMLVGIPSQDQIAKEKLQMKAELADSKALSEKFISNVITNTPPQKQRR